MSKRKGENNYNTNLASEFFVLSNLARLGIDASLSLGNKKKVDISIFNKKDGTYFTIDVKGVAGKDDWIGSFTSDSSVNHFYALVCYEEKISDLSHHPKTWIFSSQELEKYKLVQVASDGKTKFIRHVSVRDKFKKNFERWDKFRNIV
jgi:hypothetical protein